MSQHTSVFYTCNHCHGQHASPIGESVSHSVCLPVYHGTVIIFRWWKGTVNRLDSLCRFKPVPKVAPPLEKIKSNHTRKGPSTSQPQVCSKFWGAVLSWRKMTMLQQFWLLLMQGRLVIQCGTGWSTVSHDGWRAWCASKQPNCVL
jgi:hypothetical protein